MSVILKRGQDGELEYHADLRSFAAAYAVAQQDQVIAKKNKSRFPVPKQQNTHTFTFERWCKMYAHFLEPYLEEAWVTMLELGLNLKYTSFKRDLARLIYNTSASQRKHFIFLGK
jgi:hypothetical protein